jgi:hypothetical protein
MYQVNLEILSPQVKSFAFSFESRAKELFTAAMTQRKLLFWFLLRFNQG